MTRRVQKTDSEWRQQLTEEQYKVTRCAGTEPAFSGSLWDNKADGKYLCVCCSAHLFDADGKYDSGTGWPSFHTVANEDAVAEQTDSGHGMVRTEVLCNNCGSHLGHVFPDGPSPSGQRYCLNSLSLDFRPAASQK